MSPRIDFFRHQADLDIHFKVEQLISLGDLITKLACWQAFGNELY